jgi:hypothetical protein
MVLSLGVPGSFGPNDVQIKVSNLSAALL